jgi:hypothetical protein
VSSAAMGKAGPLVAGSGGEAAPGHT